MDRMNEQARNENTNWLKVILLLAGMAGVAQAAERQWINGSWVNLRAGPSANARILTQLTINTPVTVHARQGEWCEISVEPPANRGFMACRLIGNKVMSLADLGEPRLPSGMPNPAYSPERAFWIAPSVSHLLQAGDFYWNTMLNESLRASEKIDIYRDSGGEQDRQQKKPHRFPVAEFDAMKDYMRKGVVAPPGSRPAIPKEEAAEREGLRPVKPSLFKRVTDIAPASSSVEQLSAQFGLIEKIQVLGGPEWAHHRHSIPMVFGHWDIGSLKLSLQQPVVEFVIGRQGLAAALQWKAEEIQDYKQEYNCTEGFSLKQRAKVPLPDYPRVADPLVWFFVPQALPYKKVSIKPLARRFDSTLQVMYEVDLNNDGIPDVFVREMTGGLVISPSPNPEQDNLITQRVVWVNISGEWHLLQTESYGECT